MRIHTRQLLALVSTLVPLAAARAQATWTVTQQNGVQAAIQGAAPGDVILLPNTGGFPDYTPFVVNKGVTIIGNGCRVGVLQVTSTDNPLTIQVPAGQRAHLDGLDLTWSPHALGNFGIQVDHQSGVASVQRCNVRYSGNSGAVRIRGGALVLQSCTIQAVRLNGLDLPYTKPGVSVENGSVTLRDCSAVGMGAGVNMSVPHGMLEPGAAAVQVAAGSLHAERSLLTGGTGQFSLGWVTAGSGVRLSGGSTWLSDCTLVTGYTTGIAAGSAAIINNGTLTAQLRNCTLIPGLPTAPPTYGSVNLLAPLTRLGLSPDLQRGVTSTLSIAGEAGAIFAVGLALDDAPTLHPFLVEPVWIVSNVPFVAGLLDTAGTAAVLLSVPPVPNLQHALAWVQSVSGFTLPLRASTVAGGPIR